MNAALKVKKADGQIETGGLANSLGFLLRMAQVKVYEPFSGQPDSPQLKPGEFTVLWLIHLNPGVRQGVVARKLNIKPGHMTKLVRRLEERQIVTRVIPDDDRRSVELTLTKAGNDLVAATKDTFIDNENLAENNLSEQEILQLTELLKKFVGFKQE